eukprot:15065924-Alexandrium_andersonii.AAC.1
MTRADHLPVILSVDIDTERGPVFHQRKRPACDISLLKDPEIQSKILSALSSAPPIAWDTDVDTHCSQLTDQIRKVLETVGASAKRKKKDWISEETW